MGPTLLRLPLADFPGAGDLPTKVGGLAIGLAQLRRARLNGLLRRDDDSCLLDAAEAFAFLASVSPDGQPDTSHRGGRPTSSPSILRAGR